MKVALALRRKRKITSTTSAMVAASVTCTSWIESRIDCERSLRNLSSTEAGIWAISPGMAALIASTVATVLAPGWRCTDIVMARSPLAQLAVLTDSTLSSTAATSLKRTGRAPAVVETIRSANAAAFFSCRLAWIVKVWRGPSSVPTGELALALRRAVAMSSSVRLRLVKASASTRMRTANFFWPLILTCATPGSVDSVGAIRLSAKLFRSDNAIDGDVSDRKITGASAGLTLR